MATAQQLAAVSAAAKLETELQAVRASHAESSAQMMEWTAAQAAEETHLFATTLRDAQAEVESVRSSMLGQIHELQMEHSAAMEEAEERVLTSPRAAEMKLAAVSAELQTEAVAAGSM